MIALLHSQGEGFALLFGLALAHGDDFTLLRLVLGAIGDDDASPGGFSFFDTTHDNAVMQRSQLSSHSWNSFQTLGLFCIAKGPCRLGRDWFAIGRQFP